MAVPKRKTSRPRTKRRYQKFATEAQKRLTKKVNLVECGHCGEMKVSHTICSACSAYSKVRDKKASKEEPKKKIDQKEKKVVKKEVEKVENKAEDTQKTPDFPKKEDLKATPKEMPKKQGGLLSKFRRTQNKGN